MTRTTTGLAVIAAVLVAAGCSTGPVADGANPTAPPASSASSTTDAAPETVEGAPRWTAASPESAFMYTTCDMLDQGFTIDAAILTAVSTDKPFTDARASELIVEAIIDRCPQHVPALRQHVLEEGN